MHSEFTVFNFNFGHCLNDIICIFWLSYLMNITTLMLLVFRVLIFFCTMITCYSVFLALCFHCFVIFSYTISEHSKSYWGKGELYDALVLTMTHSFCLAVKLRTFLYLAERYISICTVFEIDAISLYVVGYINYNFSCLDYG